ncbi:MAG TPA: hypothetical protein PLE35_12260, partial [Lentisphaeria bacterium]|nr:hypothetical protein [Lentisphaeria bacterium]
KSAALAPPALVFGQEGPVDFWAASSAVTSVQTINEYYARSGRFVAGAKTADCRVMAHIPDHTRQITPKPYATTTPLS